VEKDCEITFVNFIDEICRDGSTHRYV
jgi:hypothetical protein